MKRKNGFTLIELLAVIVILAIIALIATPTILGVIEKAKMGAAKSSALGYIDAVEKTIAINMLDDSKTNIVDGVYLTDTLNGTTYGVTVKGNKPETNSWLVIEKNQVVNYSFKIGEYIVSYNSETKTADVVKGDTVLDKPTEKVVKLTTDVDGNGVADIGDTITIGEENFYVISNDGTTVSMLAYYNLNAGGVYDGSTWTAYENPTYRQDENMKGLVSEQTEKYGTLAFADTNGWDNSEQGKVIPTSYYSTYLTDALTNYDTYIKSLGANITSTRLITYNELLNLGCSSSSFSCSSSGKDWLYSSAYWTGSAGGHSDSSVWDVGSGGFFSSIGYDNASRYGARPVLDIPVFEI